MGKVKNAGSTPNPDVPMLLSVVIPGVLPYKDSREFATTQPSRPNGMSGQAAITWAARLRRAGELGSTITLAGLDFNPHSLAALPISSLPCRLIRLPPSQFMLKNALVPPNFRLQYLQSVRPLVGDLGLADQKSQEAADLDRGAGESWAPDAERSRGFQRDPRRLALRRPFSCGCLKQADLVDVVRDGAKRPKQLPHPRPNCIASVVDRPIGVVELAARAVPVVKGP